MYCIARQCVLPARSREQAEVLLTEAALHSLADLFEAVPDPRGAHGLRYDLPFLLTCLAAALLCNCDGTGAVAQWCRDHHALLRRVFGPRLFLTGSRLTVSMALATSRCLRSRARVGKVGPSQRDGSR
jgi:hypothetical protein